MTQEELLQLIEEAAKDGRKFLNLSGQGLTELPPKIGQLTGLKELNLSYNKLTNLPPEIGQLTGLKELNLNNNQLTTLPPEFGQLSSLNSLNLRGNQLITLPPEIGQLTGLKELNLNNNQLTTLPPEFGQLSSLNSLNLRGNQLITLPPEIGQLTGLNSLHLSENQLTTLPPEIGQLTSLNSLYLSENQLATLPPEIGQLTGLKELNLSYNKLTTIPPEFGQLSSLNSLYLWNNRLITIPPEFGQLFSLNSLYLGDNQLTTIPPEFGQLSSLHSLNLSNNQLTTVPPEFGQLSSLHSLNLRDNQLKTLPAEFGQLSSLDTLYLYNTPLTDPPPEIINRGTKAIVNYLKQQLEQDIDYIYEAKLLIIGEGGVGKTTLAQKIQNPDYQLKEEDSTQGIDIIRYHFPLDNGREFQINIWDFGGQEIYHETHQFFLTERSLYVLVVDTRKEDTDFYYWLNVVELLSNNSPLLIIKNEVQERQKDINEKQLISDFPQLIKETLATNFATNRGLSEILTHIKHQIQQLPHVGESLPSYWVKIREILEKDSRNYLSFDEFYQLCKERGFKTLEDILVLSGYLHDLGIILHFQKDDLLTKTVILKPQWGTNAVYKVLDTPQVRRNLGRFNKEDLKQIWQAEEYRMMRGELLRLMMNFKLCYEIPSQKDNYIAPQLLSANQPDYSWNKNDNLLLRYEYEFMPKGMITRFIVETHRDIENETLVWKTGVILTKDDARAEIKELYRYHKGEIRIRVMGKRKRDLLTIVRNELNKIHASYERLKYTTFVPCNCSKCKNIQNPYFYPWNVLNNAIDQETEKVQCYNSFEFVNPQTLVNDIGLFSVKIHNTSSNSNPVNVNVDVKVDQNNINQTHTGLGDNIDGDKNVNSSTVVNSDIAQIIEQNQGQVKG